MSADHVMAAETSRQTADSVAIAHFKRTGVILPGAQGTIADYLAETNGRSS